MTDAAREGQARQAFFGSVGHRLNRCLYPSDPECGRRAIRAHSIQNRGVLGLLSESGHVSMLRPRPTLEDIPETPEFALVGRNEATTFTGLCGQHDAELFRPIDTAELDLADPEHLFLVTYRSVLREAHTALQAAQRSLKVQNRLAEIGVLNPNQPGPAAAALTMPLMNAYDAYMEKAAFDILYLNGDFGAVEHQAVTVQVAEPSVAASTLFYPTRAGRRTFCTALNVFPEDGSHGAVFSYQGRNRRAISPIADRLRMLRGEAREHAVSLLLLERCENLVLRPSLKEAYSQDQREVIGTYFWDTTMGDLGAFLGEVSDTFGDYFDASVADLKDRVDRDDPRLNLFRPHAG